MTTGAAPGGAAENAVARDASLRRSVKDGAAHAVMLGCGEAYLVPFALFVGAGDLLIGLLASLPLLLGSLSQLVIVRALDHAGGRRRFVIVPVAIQAASFIPLVVLPLAVPTWGPELTLACALVYFVSGSIVVPPWNSWMGDLVDPKHRGEYFGRRDRVRTFFQLLALVGAGLVLQLADRAGREVWGFVALFGVAMGARVVSATQLGRMYEPPYVPPRSDQQFGFADFLVKSPRANFGRFVLYASFFYAATNLAGPFFTPYMLRDLGLSWLEFTGAATAFITTQSLTFHAWGRLADRYGSRRILAATGMLLPFVPLQWLLSTSVWAIIVFQALSGVLWAGFALATSNFIFDAVTPAKRARCVAYYAILTNTGLFAGGFAGGLIARALPEHPSFFGWTPELASKLQVLFVASACARLVVSVGMLRLIREVRPVEPSSGFGVLMQMVGLPASRGARYQVFTGVHRSERDDAEAEADDPHDTPRR